MHGLHNIYYLSNKIMTRKEDNMDNKLCAMTDDELLMCDGGVIPVALGVAFVALFGTGFTAGVTMGIKKWF